MEQVSFHGHGPCPTPQGPLWAGRVVQGFCLWPTQATAEINPRLGPHEQCTSPNFLGIPLGPFEVADHAPFPSLP